MADLSGVNSTQPVKIAGANPTTGVGDNYLEVDTAGRITTRLNDGAGTSVTVGQKTMALSLPVVISSDQTAIPVSQSGAWSVTANAGTNLNTSALALDTSVVALQVTQASTTSGQKGTLIQAAVTTAAPTYTTAQTSPLSLTTTGLLRIDASGTVVSVSQSGTWNINNISGTISLPTGASTSALQTSGNSSLSSIDGKLVDNFGVATTALRTASQLGNATGSADFNAGTTSAQTLRVVLPTDQTAIPSSQSGTWNINNISGTISLPTGAATSASQTTINNSIQETHGTVAAGTVASKSELIGGQYNATLPTLTTTQQAALQVDSNGRLLIAPTQTSPLPATGSGFSFGDLTTSSSATFLRLNRTTYTEQTANSTMSIASSSASDAAAGTGARTITITYLDSTGAGPNTTTVTLNGVSFVNTSVSNLCFIEKIVVATAGSTGSNVGILTLKAAAAGAGATVGTINATDNRTFWGHHYVPIAKTCYISGFSFSSSSTTVGAGAVFSLFSQNPTSTISPLIQVSDINTLTGAAAGTTTRTYVSPIQVPGPSKVTIYVQPVSNTSTVQRGSFDYIDN